MKHLDALVMTFNLDRLKEQLHALGVKSMPISEIRSAGGARSPDLALLKEDFLPRIRIRVLVPDHVAARAADILRLAV